MSSFLDCCHAVRRCRSVIALLVERQAQVAQLRTRQFARTLHHDGERGDLVDVVAHEAREAIEKVLGLLAVP